MLVAGAAIFDAAGPRSGHARAPSAGRRRPPADGSAVTRSAPRRSRVRVRYAETDQMGVVYHANYFVWFEVGRTELLRTLGWTYREMEARRVRAAGHRGALCVPPPGALR